MVLFRARFRAVVGELDKANLFRLIADGKITPTNLGKRSLFMEAETTRFIDALKEISRRQ
jgi:hypothetical protein